MSDNDLNTLKDALDKHAEVQEIQVSREEGGRTNIVEREELTEIRTVEVLKTDLERLNERVKRQRWETSVATFLGGSWITVLTSVLTAGENLPTHVSAIMWSFVFIAVVPIAYFGWSARGWKNKREQLYEEIISKSEPDA